MKISRIEFENFRNFKDHCQIDFPTDGSVTVIYGPNGVGKTTLHQLFQWIIYGEVHFNNTASKELYNLDFEQSATLHQTFPVWGRIDFEHPSPSGKIEKFSFLRKWTYRKELSATKLVDQNFIVAKDLGDNKWQMIPGDPKVIVEQILPSGLSQYFFFDGESMIADLGTTGKESAKALRKALYSLFNLNIYEQATVHLGTTNSGTTTVLGKLYKQLSESSTNSEVIVAKGAYSQAQKYVEDLQKDIDNYRTFVEKYHSLAQGLSEKIGSAPSRASLEAQRKTAKTAIKKVEDLSAEKMLAFGATVMTTYPHLLISRVVEEAKYRIGLKVEEQELPQGLTKELVLTLLNSDTCLCGHPITEKERLVLEELRRMFPPLSYKYIYDQFKSTAARWSATYDSTLLLDPINKIFQNSDEINALLQTIHDIDNALKETGQKDDLIEKRAAAEQSAREWQRKLSAAERDMGVRERLQKQAKNKLDKALQANSHNIQIKNNIEIMEAVSDYFVKKLSTSAAMYSASLCNAIQALLDKMLLGSRRVSVSTRFELSVRDSHGNEAKSEGQFAIVSFAYIGGILKLLRDVPELNNKEFPLVLDGPFSKLDALHRQNVIDTIPSYAPQVILFSKDDINNCFGENGPKNVWTIYSNDERNISTVKRGYDPEVFKANGA